MITKAPRPSLLKQLYDKAQKLCEQRPFAGSSLEKGSYIIHQRDISVGSLRFDFRHCDVYW